ncbi:uncharacterized protein LOC144577067 [Callithrix jacchus]
MAGRPADGKTETVSRESLSEAENTAPPPQSHRNRPPNVSLRRPRQAQKTSPRRVGVWTCISEGERKHRTRSRVVQAMKLIMSVEEPTLKRRNKSFPGTKGKKIIIYVNKEMPCPERMNLEGQSGYNGFATLWWALPSLNFLESLFTL